MQDDEDFTDWLINRENSINYNITTFKDTSNNNCMYCNNYKHLKYHTYTTYPITYCPMCGRKLKESTIDEY